MKNVSSKYLSVLLLSAALLTSCKSPELEVASLGKKLPAPSLKGSSPFDQDFDLQNYVRIQGSCDARVGNILLSFDKTTWHQPPSIPDTTGTSLTGVTNDRDCSDGSFDLYLTKNDLENIWGIVGGSNGTDVDYIYIKGETLIGDTAILILQDPEDHGGGNGSSPATTVNIEKTWPAGFAGSGQCDSMRVYLTNAQGYRATHTSAISFSVQNTFQGVTTPISAYNTFQDCDNDSSGTAGQTTFSIPAGQDGIDIIYKFPTNAKSGTMTFKIASPSALTANPTDYLVTMRDSSSTATRWLSLEDHRYQIYKDVCYPMKMRTNLYNRTMAYDNINGIISLTTSDSRMKFYSDTSCSTESSIVNLPDYGSEFTIYVKYASGTDSDSYKSFNISATTASGSAYNYDFAPYNMKVDLSNKNTTTKVGIWGPRDVTRHSCQHFDIVVMNDNGTRMPASSNATINLSTVESSVGTFYASDICSAGSEITQTNVATGSDATRVYFKATINDGTYHFKLGGLTQMNNTELRVKTVATRITYEAPSNFWDLSLAPSCVPVIMTRKDAYYNPAYVPSSLSIALTVNFSDGVNNRVFSDASCSAPLSSTVTIPAGSATTTFYISKLGIPNGTNVSISSFVPGLYSETLSGTLFIP
ncbi:hypothetical protein AZI87_09425 [Bdellovibrio bacteriovorus]|uniref:Lipoprotein n=1 Tax=Bdellovibrio bacteriovorus TaxID=959 RepID=A0A162H0S5_BDEBC|nr:hypothetical protein [Bdellovibrio bacteriovorus]KYG69391.1 hypothetical protein AZI87_09425 [Bdellovibrio bacteriovorus]